MCGLRPRLEQAARSHIRQAISDATAIRDDEAIAVALDLASTALYAGLLDERRVQIPLKRKQGERGCCSS